MQAQIAGAVLVLAACAVLAVAVACWLARRCGTLRGRRPALRCPVPEPAGRGPETAVMRMWLCEACRWTWPLADLFCGTCGRSRAVASEGREVRSLSLRT